MPLSTKIDQRLKALKRNKDQQQQQRQAFLIKVEDVAQQLGSGAFGSVDEVVDFVNAQVKARKTFNNQE